MLFVFWLFRRLSLLPCSSRLSMDKSGGGGSRQWVRHTLYAVMIGISPMLLGLLLLALVRLILHRLELLCSRRQSFLDRRQSSVFSRKGRPTLSYTPVPLTELHRIIQGDPSSQQFSDSSSSSFTRNDSRRTKTPFLASLVIRRDALDSTPLTALLAPIARVDTINERRATHSNDCHETLTLARLQSNRSKMYDFYESNHHSTDRLLPSFNPRRLTATIRIDESFDYYSVSSIPSELNAEETC